MGDSAPKTTNMFKGLKSILKETYAKCPKCKKSKKDCSCFSLIKGGSKKSSLPNGCKLIPETTFKRGYNE